MFLVGNYLLSGVSDTDVVYEIRQKVFSDEQGLPDFVVRDDDDIEAIFAVAYEEEDEKRTPVGTARLLFLGEEFKIGRLCVLKEFRGRGYADFLVRMLLDKAFSMGATEVHVDARLHAVGFYKKIGFVENGAEKQTNGFDEQPMILKKDNLCKKCQESGQISD